MIETYAPGLVYAPVGRPLDDKELSNEKETLRNLLKSGKKFLREKRPDFAYEEFKRALPIAQRIGDTNEEKKAARGLGKSQCFNRIAKMFLTYASLFVWW